MKNIKYKILLTYITLSLNFANADDINNEKNKIVKYNEPKNNFIMKKPKVIALIENIKKNNLDNISDLNNKLKENFVFYVLKKNILMEHYKGTINKKCYIYKTSKEYSICTNKEIEILSKNQNEKIKNKEKELTNKLGIDFNDFNLNKLTINEEKNKDILFTIDKKIKETKINKNTFFVLINKELQEIYVFSYLNEKIEIIGIDKISTGDTKKEITVKYGKDHFFETPSGNFEMKNGWRADGEYNSDGYTKAYGNLNNHIFFLGEQESFYKNLKKKKIEKGYLHLALHAHYPNYNLGTKQSHGCIRSSIEFNEFLDNNFILNENNLNDKEQWSNRNISTPNIINYYGISGKYVFIIDKLYKNETNVIENKDNNEIKVIEDKNIIENKDISKTIENKDNNEINVIEDKNIIENKDVNKNIENKDNNEIKVIEDINIIENKDINKIIENKSL